MKYGDPIFLLAFVPNYYVRKVFKLSVHIVRDNKCFFFTL